MKNEKKIKTFLVATNVVASRPPERRPTATPTARANYTNKHLTNRILPESWTKSITERPDASKHPPYVNKKRV